jgi:6-pyruvoyltetrahydropterin/6-carboxytetrahydropterin synthase
MFRLRIETEFDAAHKIVGYEGKCKNLHGHTWKVEVFILGKSLDKIGILIDYGVLKEKLRETTDNLDHSYLNDKPAIGNPTSENIAKFIFEKIKKLPDQVKLERVRIWESPRSWCEYFE